MVTKEHWHKDRQKLIDHKAALGDVALAKSEHEVFGDDA